jgi:hypothetical protein
MLEIKYKKISFFLKNISIIYLTLFIFLLKYFTSEERVSTKRNKFIRLVCEIN